MSAVVWGVEFEVRDFTPNVRPPHICTHSPPTRSCL